MKYSKNFERDYAWFLKYKDQFDFDGASDTKDKVIYNSDGKDAKYCFYLYDSQGKVIPTNEPELLFELHKCKGSINFHIKMWAEGRADGTLPLVELSQRKCISMYPEYELDDNIKDYEAEYELLDWMVEAVEKQKYKYYGKVF